MRLILQEVEPAGGCHVVATCGHGAVQALESCNGVRAILEQGDQTRT